MSKIVENYKVEGSEWSNALDKAFDKINKKVKIDGFRQGKAPRNIYEKKYGNNLSVKSTCSIPNRCLSTSISSQPLSYRYFIKMHRDDWAAG